MKKSERRKLHSLPSKQVKEVREKQQANQEISRKQFRQRHQQRSLWGHNEYSDDDFVSRLLVKWTFAQLLEYSKLLVLLINRRSAKPLNSDLPAPMSALVYLKYHSEYYDTLFASYTLTTKDGRSITFCAYYTEIYREAMDHASSSSEPTVWLTRYHCAMLKACFMVALTYDARIRRFVFTRHDIHYNYMRTHPPPVNQTSQFIREMQPLVNQFIEGSLGGEELAAHTSDAWLSQYMFRIE